MYGRRRVSFGRRRRSSSRGPYRKRNRGAMVRQRRPTGVGGAPMLLRFPLPRRAFCLHTYNTTLTLALPATSDTAYAYMVAENDIFNPDPDNGSYRATFWDEMRTLYAYWSVRKSSIELTVTPPTHPINIMVVESPSFSTTGSTGVVFGTWERQYGNKALFAPEDTEKTIMRAWSAKLMLPGNNDNVQGSSSPTDPEYFSIVYAQSDTAAAAHSVTVNIKLTYLVEWTKDLGVTDSDIPPMYRKPGVVEPGVERLGPKERRPVGVVTEPDPEHVAHTSGMPSLLAAAIAEGPQRGESGDETSDTDIDEIGAIGGALASARPFDANEYLFGTKK